MLYQKTSYLRLSLDAQLENGLSKAANGCFCQQECAKCKSTCKCPLLDYYLYTIILCPFVKVVLPKPMPTPDEKSIMYKTNYIDINSIIFSHFQCLKSTVWSVNDGLSIYRKPAGNLLETCRKPAKNQFTKVSSRFPEVSGNLSLRDHTVFLVNFIFS